MRIAAIYDMHANLLEAVIAEIRQQEVDGVVVGGDVLPGPMPLETLERLQDLDLPVRFVYGNGEVAVLEQLAGRDPIAVPEPYRPIIRWTAEQLHPEHRRFLAAWPKTLCLDLPGLGEVLFCHATPRDENECFTRWTPESQLLPVFAGVRAALVVCGHTRMQFDRRVARSRVVNAGSVGMPFGNPRAQWLLRGPDVELRRTPYDLPQAAERIRGTTYPQAEDFAAHSVRDPPSEQAMLEVFSRVGVK